MNEPRTTNRRRRWPYLGTKDETRRELTPSSRRALARTLGIYNTLFVGGHISREALRECVTASRRTRLILNALEAGRRA